MKLFAIIANTIAVLIAIIILINHNIRIIIIMMIIIITIIIAIIIAEFLAMWWWTCGSVIFPTGACQRLGFGMAHPRNLGDRYVVTFSLFDDTFPPSCMLRHKGFPVVFFEAFSIHIISFFRWWNLKLTWCWWKTLRRCYFFPLGFPDSICLSAHDQRSPGKRATISQNQGSFDCIFWYWVGVNHIVAQQKKYP